jgi:hypothetical protein
VGSTLPPAREKAEAVRVVDRVEWRIARERSTLIDTRLVRAELARLRGPRAETEVYRARAIRSTLSGDA